MNTTPKTPDELLDWWPGDIPFKGSLVSDDGCMCAQGQALHYLDNMSAADLRQIKQTAADNRVAELFGISRAHAVLLRKINDGRPGAPSVVIRDPAQVLGDQSHIVLAFWRHLDRMTTKDWDAAGTTAWTAAETAAETAAVDAAVDAAGTAAEAARAAAVDAAVAAAGIAARTAAVDAAGTAAEAAVDAAGIAAGIAAWDAAGGAAVDAAGASNEIQGAAIMRARGRAFYFLPLFGFADPEAVLTAEMAL